ncbi:MAG: alpha/beta hydrolase [Candidatus Gastranaerophilales bacterium]|nr:alpha/beta hydrolase [Candidatus Gastranaerophilales bacterium]
MKKKKTITILVLILLFLVGLGVFAAYNKNSKTAVDRYVRTIDGINIAFTEYKTGHDEVLIIAPGWFMCKSSSPFVEMAIDFSKDFDVIALDFRGHCKSSGKFTFTSREYNDLKAVVDYARKKYKKVYAAGFSLGSATAIIEQYKYNNLDKLILVSPPSDFDKIENAIWKKEAFIPTFKKFEIETWTGIIPGKVWLSKEKPIEIIDKIAPTPLLMIAGTKDPTIKVWHTVKLFNTAKDPKKLIIYGDSIHAEDIYLQNRQRFIKTCTEWLKTNDYSVSNLAG